MKEFESLICDLERAAFFNGQSSDEPGELDNAHHELLRRYELAQRARARNLVSALTDRKIRIWNDPDEWDSLEGHLRLGLVNWLDATADRIAAKYLEGKS